MVPSHSRSQEGVKDPGSRIKAGCSRRLTHCKVHIVSQVLAVTDLHA